MDKKKSSRKKTVRAVADQRETINAAALRAEAMLAEAQRIFHVGSWEWDLATGKIEFSEEMYRLFGMLPGAVEITRDVFIQFLHADEAEQTLQEFQHSASHPFSSIEHRIVLPDGITRIAHTRVKAYKDEHGNPMRLLGTTQDVTERRRIEEALRVAEADYRAIFESAPIGIFRSTMGGHLIKANQTMAEMYGYVSAEQMIAEVKSIANQMYAKPLLRQEFVRLLAEQGEVLGFESLDRRKDGSTFWTSMNARAVKNAAGEIAYYEGFVSDITARKHSESVLRELNEELRVQLEAVQELQAILHDQAIHDQLTGLYNRRYMQEAMTHEYARAVRNEYPISIIVLDLDRLKEINKQYGHFSGGDVALQSLGEHLKSMIRAEDIACRYGGDEFIIMLHNTPAQVAYERAEQWRRTLIQMVMDSNGVKFNISFSAGVAAFPTHGRNIDEVMQSADKALYHAKDLGRNRVMLAE